MEFTTLTDEQLASVFQRNQADYTILNALNEELKGRNSDFACDLHMSVVVALRLARRATEEGAPVACNAKPTQKSGPIREWLRNFRGARNLKGPDGRALYRYRMTDEEFLQARDILGHVARRGRLEEPDLRSGALFVAYCAEWFRRESASTFLKWDAIDPELFPKVPYPSKQKLTELGLQYWERDLRRSQHGREFLLTLALEGGFPVKVFLEGARSWLQEYLRAVLRRALDESIVIDDRLLEIAVEERWRVSKSYDHDDFVALCAELAGAVLGLRRQAEERGLSGVNNSAILDAIHADWRQDLPIYVPAEDEALARELLTGLLDEKFSGHVARGIEARRYLTLRDGEWLPALQLLADGEIASSSLASFSPLGRIRVTPASQLVEHVSGEIALLEPPTEGGRAWRMRPLMRTSRLLCPYPLSVQVSVTLSSASSPPVTWTWPGGEARHSDVLVFQLEEGTAGRDKLLRLVRSGSASLPAQSLHVLFPADWLMEIGSESAVISDVIVVSLRRRLVEVQGTIYVWGPKDDARYRIETGVQARSIELQLPFADVNFRLSEKDREIVSLGTTPMVSETERPRLAKPGEIYCRRAGEPWRELRGPLNAPGLHEISLRDPKANIQIDKVKLALLPYGSRLDARMSGPSMGHLRLEGLAGWSVSAPQLSATDDPTLLNITFPGRPNYQLPVTLHPPQGRSFDVVLSISGSEAVVTLADGSVLPAGATVNIGALRGASVISPSRVSLEIAPKGARSGSLVAEVDGELPLGVLRSAMQEILATLGEQDDLLELSFLGDTRTPIRITRFSEKMLPLEAGEVVWAGDAELVARMILDPRHEHALEPLDESHWRLPERCQGPCLVYLRDGPDVLSRPRIISGATLGEAPALLAAAGLIRDYDERQSAIAAQLQTLADGHASQADFSWLTNTVTHLRGLPANTIDALRLLPAHPHAAIALLVKAADTDRAAIWALQDELPLLWLGLPLEGWNMAMTAIGASMFESLQPIFGNDKAAAMALDSVNKATEQLSVLEPALTAAVADAARRKHAQSTSPSLNTLVSEYIKAQFDRHRDDPNDIAEALSSRKIPIPQEILTKTHELFAGLFAPVLLAASALGKVKISKEDALLIRRVLREDPFYVTATWIHMIDFYGATGK
ncbi:STY4851/ECs_5259 family protein [Hoeflea alexandrii]|uniref:Uncharacterized protein n=2 Tax=Hoeflea alexandrii TaxID=288436 RepID=A0ABT1CS89_9HYPH|nr:STY4851/ECs_5259 family protein [Hoeflea alexandrii]MCO6409060.1 hypothetical protein [Hoeflea alexandrii]